MISTPPPSFHLRTFNPQSPQIHHRPSLGSSSQENSTRTSCGSFSVSPHHFSRLANSAQT
ncbi:hypothetical protein BofuT4_uP118610.1 [Botrytis cinerea T4]|uniref:Uncharacterized protein n=1 Tax=Botryotinia fuckeliana (strain T4) TaxID=999810 RepID=G2Y0Z6_BOTF4|nr:hypothetical protein BofuT4_uP118610.1 [Botrytis cinerea T4]